MCFLHFLGQMPLRSLCYIFSNVFLRLSLNLVVLPSSCGVHAGFSHVSFTAAVLVKTKRAFYLSFLITKTATWLEFYVFV